MLFCRFGPTPISSHCHPAVPLAVRERWRPHFTNGLDGVLAYAILMIALVSWGLYHFLASKDWRDWAGAGLLQAFVIALYSEMYGFPLTISVLTSFLPIKIPMVHDSGHLWATFLGYGRGGGVVEMLVGSVFVVTGLVLIVRGWVRIYFTACEMITDGVYRIMRHPQYTGIFLAIFGCSSIGQPFRHWRCLPNLPAESADVLSSFAGSAGYIRSAPGSLIMGEK